MALNLKRKRRVEEGSRKTRKVEDDLSGSDASIHSLEEQHLSDHEDEDESSAEINEEDDGEEWEGLKESNNEVAEEIHLPGTKPKKPPTGEELRDIRDATDLFRSSSFKLQIDALLPNVGPKQSRIQPLERFLLSLHTFLATLPPISPKHPLEASRTLLAKGISVPYSVPLPTEETNWKVAFEKPSDITLVGSWPLKISVKAKDGIKFGVDVAVEMPNSLFQEKDYLNGRFFHKRAFYLAVIATAIAVKGLQSGLNVDTQYQSASSDPRLTKLVLTPKSDNSQNDFSKLNAQVCIIPVLSLSCPISLHRLSPSHSNIRINSSAKNESKESNTATPIYNTALLSALTPKAQLLAIHALKEETPAFGDAVTLLRVWANQRGYGPGSKMCVSGFEARGSWWSALLGLLVAGEERATNGKLSKRRPVGKGLSSYQLFRATLDFLSKHNFRQDPIFVRARESHRFPPEEYQQNHTMVFVDSTSTVNLLAGVPIGSIELLCHDALKTLEALDHALASTDPFTDIFLTDHRDLSSRFDTILRVDLSSAKPLALSLHSTLDYGSAANALMASLSSLVHHGLGDRTKAASILHAVASPRHLSQAHPPNPSIIYVGLIHDPSTAYRLVDHGPAADDEDTSKLQAFRDFWGDKAELRRFKDGRIVESVVWDVKTADERAHIPAMIVRHVLKRHFNLDDTSIHTWQTSFDSLLRLPEAISSKYRTSGATTGFKGAMTAFDNLVKTIKGLDKALPLAVLNISPFSEQLRYTSVFSPVPLPPSLAPAMPRTARYLSPIYLILEFEKSSRWPDDLKAIQKTKLAFFERIAAELMSSTNGLQAAVVVGDGVHKSEILDKVKLEIITPEGWAFALSIWNDREAVLLDRIIDDYNKPVPPALKTQQKGHDGKDGKQFREAVEAKEVYTRRFIHAPRHHRAVAALCHQYSAFAGTVRLVKRWLAAHWLLHGHITEEVVELICAAFFVGDGRRVGVDLDEGKKGQEDQNVPGSKERGFAMVIACLKDWKWEEEWFIPLYGIRKPTEETQTILPKDTRSGVWKVSTEFDKDGRMWTSHGPDIVVAHRVKALAKATWDHLQAMEEGTFTVKPMFIHPTDAYDVVVHLNPDLLPRYFHNVTVDLDFPSSRGKYANLQEDQHALVRPGFDPARLLFDDLQRTYAHTFKIFYDMFGGDCFGIVWDPSLKEPRPFRVLGEFSSIPLKKENEKSKEKGLVVLNEPSVLSEIERLGSSLVKEITVHVS